MFFELFSYFSRQQGLSARVLYINNLSRQMTEGLLQERFTRTALIACHLPIRPIERFPRGYGFVRMATPEAAPAAIRAVNMGLLMGQNISVAQGLVVRFENQVKSIHRLT